MFPKIFFLSLLIGIGAFAKADSDSQQWGTSFESQIGPMNEQFIKALFVIAEPDVPLSEETEYRAAALRDYQEDQFQDVFFYPTIEWLQANSHLAENTKYIQIQNLVAWYIAARTHIEAKEFKRLHGGENPAKEGFIPVDCTVKCIDSMTDWAVKLGNYGAAVGGRLAGPPGRLGGAVVGATAGATKGAIECANCMAQQRRIEMPKVERPRIEMPKVDQLKIDQLKQNATLINRLDQLEKRINSVENLQLKKFNIPTIKSK